MSNQLTIVVLWLGISTGCVKGKWHSFTDIVSLTNETSNDVILYFESSFGSDTLFANGIDTVSFIHTEKKYVESHIAGSTPSYIPVHLISHFEMFDLSDTLSYKLRIENNYKLTSNDSIFLTFINDNATSNRNGVSREVKHNVIYGKWIDSIMKKDSTMLEKFKDYYKK